MIKKHNFINDEVIIDFKIPEGLFELINYLEELDIKEDYSFYNFAESLEYSGRYYVKNGEMTKQQWITLCNKYGGF